MAIVAVLIGIVEPVERVRFRSLMWTKGCRCKLVAIGRHEVETQNSRMGSAAAVVRSAQGQQGLTYPQTSRRTVVYLLS